MNPIPDLNPETHVDIQDSCNCASNCCVPKKKHKKTCEVAKERFDKDFEHLKHTQSAPPKIEKVKKTEGKK